METVGINEATKILQCHRQTVLKYVQVGQLQGRKVGRAWVFVVDDLVNFIRGGNNGPCLPVPCGKETSWHYTNEKKHTGLVSQRQTEKELDALLAPTTGRRRKSSLTS